MTEKSRIKKKGETKRRKEKTFFVCNHLNKAEHNEQIKY